MLFGKLFAVFYLSNEDMCYIYMYIYICLHLLSLFVYLFIIFHEWMRVTVVPVFLTFMKFHTGKFYNFRSQLSVNKRVMIISLLTDKICQWSLHSYIDDDSKNVNSNWLKLFTTERYFSFYRKKNMATVKRLKENPIKYLQWVSFVNMTSILLKCWKFHF